ncbi:MAG TPA: CoA-transferase [Dehalococcoidia bacterium]|nr:CoA-transferase [Dehalococcoidia bacterium]
MSPQRPASTEELLIVLMSRDIRDWETCACGALSMIPAASMLLAEATSAPHIETIILGSDQLSGNLGKDIHFLAQRGKLDLFYHSAIQFDAAGDFNLHVIGDPDAPDRRLPGGYGSGLISYTAKRIFFFRTEHSKRTFVEKVDFVSGAGVTPPEFKRAAEPFRVYTPMAILTFDREAARYAVESVHEGFTIDDVRENTTFELDAPDPCPTTPPLTDDELATLRGEVRERMVETGTYADWAAEALQPG